MGNACDLVNKWKTGSPAEKTAKETWMPVGNLYSIDIVLVHVSQRFVM